MTVDFNDYFWGEKNNGFDVLYHNMKFGLVASRELSEFFREKSNIEEQNSKMMSKLAHKASTGTLNSTFAPVWTILRTSAEKISTLHLQMVQKLTELVKDVAKYADELHKKHKMVKEEESQTLECVQAMQASTASVQKSRDVYTSKVLELEKLRKENGSQKDIEKIETKLKKLQEEYKTLLDKHNPIKSDFERRMTQTCKRFQEIEEVHLRQMKEFLSTYLELLQNNHDMVGQVHSDFKRQFLDMSVDKLLEQFVLNKYTGLEKPEVAELDFIPLSIQQNQQQSSSTSRLNHPVASITSSVTANTTNSNSASSIQGAMSRMPAPGNANMDQRVEALSLGSGGSGSGSLLNADDSILGFTTTNSMTARPTSPALINSSITASPPQSVSSLQSTNLSAPPITPITTTTTTTPPTTTTTTSAATPIASATTSTTTTATANTSSSSTTTIKSNIRSWFSSSIPSNKQSSANAQQQTSSSGNFGMDSNGSSTGTTVTKNPSNSELQSLQDNNNQDDGLPHNVSLTPPPLASTTAIPPSSLGCRKFSEQFTAMPNERSNNHHTQFHHHHHQHHQQHHHHHQQQQFHHHANANASSSSASASASASSSTTTTSTSAMNAANSRRTTSLLNIFTSNSQVSGILRSRRDKAKTKKSKKKKDDENSENIQEERLASVERANNSHEHGMSIGRDGQNSKLKMALNSSGGSAGATSSLSAGGNADSPNGGAGGAGQSAMSVGMLASDAIGGSAGIGGGSSSHANTSGSSGATAAGTATVGGLKSANHNSSGSGGGGGAGGAYKTTDVDEDGYSIQPPKEIAWEEHKGNTGSFYSDSDSDSDNDKPERRIHVKIKPLNNGQAPMSASVDELRATVENISLSPTGVFSHSQQLQQSRIPSRQQSPEISNASTPTASVHPYAPLQSPTLSMSNNSRYADLGDIFSELGDMSASAPASATLSKSNSRQIPTPTSASSIAIPRPPSRRSEMMVAASANAGARGRNSPQSTQMNRAESVGSLEFRPTIGGMGSSRGPSPLTIGISESIPLAVAFHEIIHAFFRGNDETRCQVKISGDMMISFPAGIAGLLANNPNPAKLGFRIKNFQNLENFIPNAKLVQIDKNQSSAFSTLLEFNMTALTAVLRRQAEHNPNASYFNVDILKYQVRTKPGASSCPFQLVSYWKCESNYTALKIDYKYNNHAMASASPLLNVTLSVPVSGSVRNVQSKPHSAWLGESNRLVWNFTDISQNSQDGGVGTLRARLELNDGPSEPALLSTQFNCEGTTLSGIEFELQGNGYRISLVKRRFVSGKYICEGDGVRSCVTPTPTSIGSTSPY